MDTIQNDTNLKEDSLNKKLKNLEEIERKKLEELKIIKQKKQEILRQESRKKRKEEDQKKIIIGAVTMKLLNINCEQDFYNWYDENITNFNLEKFQTWRVKNIEINKQKELEKQQRKSKHNVQKIDD